MYRLTLQYGDFWQSELCGSESWPGPNPLLAYPDTAKVGRLLEACFRAGQRGELFTSACR